MRLKNSTRRKPVESYHLSYDPYESSALLSHEKSLNSLMILLGRDTSQYLPTSDSFSSSPELSLKAQSSALHPEA